MSTSRRVTKSRLNEAAEPPRPRPYGLWGNWPEGLFPGRSRAELRSEQEGEEQLPDRHSGQRNAGPTCRAAASFNEFFVCFRRTARGGSGRVAGGLIGERRWVSFPQECPRDGDAQGGLPSSGVRSGPTRYTPLRGRTPGSQGRRRAMALWHTKGRRRSQSSGRLAHRRTACGCVTSAGRMVTEVVTEIHRETRAIRDRVTV